jgi:hypothetical protein
MLDRVSSVRRGPVRADPAFSEFARSPGSPRFKPDRAVAVVLLSSHGEGPRSQIALVAFFAAFEGTPIGERDWVTIH